MDKSIPAGAAMLLDFIGGIEAPRGYLTVYGNNQAKLKKPLTSMTLDQVEAAGPTWTRQFGSSACGRYQFMRDTLDAPGTLADLEGEMNLSGDELFSPDLQDRMGFHLLQKRGYAAFVAGRLSAVTFALRLAQEWASMPVLATTKGAHRTVSRGQTYYAGDGVNKVLTKPEAVESLLAKVLAAGNSAQAPTPRPRPAAPAPDEPAADLVIDRTNAGEDDAAPEPITDAATVETAQTRLRELGYTEVGIVNGKMDTYTQTAILAFRNENDILPLTPTIDAAFLAALAQAKPRTISSTRTDATSKDVRAAVPEVKANWFAKIGAWILGVPSAIGVAVSGAVDNVPSAKGILEPIKEVAADVPPIVWFLLVGAVAFGIWKVANHGEKKGTEAFQSGERR